MQNQEYQLVTMLTDNQYYYMLIKEINQPVTEVGHKYFIIPLDHVTAELFSSYNRIQTQIHTEINQQDVKNVTFDKIKTSIKNPIFYINELHAFDVLVDFIALGNQPTRNNKKEFIKDYVAKLKHQQVFRN